MESNVFTKPNAFISRWTIHPERRDEFLSIWRTALLEYHDVYREVTNFMYFGFSRDPNVVVSVESFCDESQLQSFRDSDEFKNFISSLLSCCTEHATIELFSGFDGDRAVFDVFPQGPSRVHAKSEVNQVNFI